MNEEAQAHWGLFAKKNVANVNWVTRITSTDATEST